MVTKSSSSCILRSHSIYNDKSISVDHNRSQSTSFTHTIHGESILLLAEIYQLREEAIRRLQLVNNNLISTTEMIRWLETVGLV